MEVEKVGVPRQICPDWRMGMTAPAFCPHAGAVSYQIPGPDIDREQVARDEEHPPAGGVSSELPVFAPEESCWKKNSGLTAPAYHLR